MDLSELRAHRGAAHMGRLAEDDAPVTDVGILATAQEDGAEPARVHEEEGIGKSLIVTEALKHAWQDLVFHHEQRMVHMRFFLLVNGALIAGFAQAFATKYYGF